MSNVLHSSSVRQCLPQQLIDNNITTVKCNVSLPSVDILESLPNITEDLKDSPVKTIEALSLAAYQVWLQVGQIMLFNSNLFYIIKELQ